MLVIELENVQDSRLKYKTSIYVVFLKHYKKSFEVYRQ